MEKINFVNKPNTTTPINDKNLNKMQDNIESAIEETNENVDTINSDLSEFNNYSENETFTGKHWTNGKKVYRKVLNLGSLPNAEQKKYSWNIENITEVTDFKVYAIDSNNGSKLSLPYVYPSTSYIDYWITVEYVTLSDILIVTGIDRSRFNLQVVLEYTKNN